MPIPSRRASCLWAFLLSLTLFPALAHANILWNLKPGETTSKQVREILGEPTLSQSANALAVKEYTRRDEGIALVRAWYGNDDVLAFFMAKLEREFDVNTATLLFVLTDEPKQESGDAFGAGGVNGRTTHYMADGVHFHEVDGVVQSIWITAPDVAASDVRTALKPQSDDMHTGLQDEQDDDGVGDNPPSRFEEGGNVGRLGLFVTALTPEIAESMGVPGLRGIVVLAAAPGSAAETAGLLPEDVIFAVDKQPMQSPEQLSAHMDSTRTGQLLWIDFVRDGRREYTMPELLAEPDDTVGANENVGRPPSWLALGVSTLTKQEAINLGVLTYDGALVRRVKPDGPAYNAGLREGDVVIQYGRWRISNSRALLRLAASSAAGKPVEVIGWRGDQKLNLTITPVTMPEPEPGIVQEPMPIPAWGLSVRRLNAATAEAVGVSAKYGLCVSAVIDGGPAAKAGLQVGDIINRVQGLAIFDPTPLLRMDRLPNLRVLYVRDGLTFITLLKRHVAERPESGRY